jgi:anti-sigma B factor antagonist
VSLNLNVRENSGVTVIEILGRLTLGEVATRLTDEVRGLCAEGKKRILLNLAGLTNMDSSGLGLLVSAYATVNREGGQLRLSNLTSRIKDLLLVTKLYAVLDVYEDEPAALASFAVLARESVV